MKKRMFTDDITGSGKFLRMSEGAQLLYFHMGLNADDDGIVDAFAIMRMTNAKEDDLVLLVEREFVVMLEPKEMIVWLSGWQDFNKIDPRIKEDSKYLPLLLAKVEGVEIVISTKKEANRRRYQSLKIARKLTREQTNKKYYDENRENLQSKKNDPPLITRGSTVDPVRSHTTSIVKYSIDKEKYIKENFSSLPLITDEICKDIASRYSVDEKVVRATREDLKLYCESTGKTYKNYKATLERWIRTGIKDGKISKINFMIPIYPLTTPKASPEIRSKTRESIGRMLGGLNG